MSIRQNNELQLNWVVNLLQLTIEQLVFINETLFNETMKWHQQVYASIDESARYQVSKKREHFWSVLSAYTINDYLFCIDIREDWFNDKVLTLQAAFALTLSEGLFNLDEMREKMSEFFRDRFWLRRDDDMMTSRVKREKNYKNVSTVKRLNSFKFTSLIFLLIFQ